MTTSIPVEKKKSTMLIIGLIAVPILLLVIVPLVITVAYYLQETHGTPAFTSADDIKTDEIDTLDVRLFNLRASYNPDRKEDSIGPYFAKPADYDRLLAPLRSAKVVDSLPPKAFLGEYRIRMKNGERQVIRLSFVLEDLPDGSARIARVKYKIGTLSFTGGPVSQLVDVVEACDPQKKNSK